MWSCNLSMVEVTRGGSHVPRGPNGGCNLDVSIGSHKMALTGCCLCTHSTRNLHYDLESEDMLSVMPSTVPRGNGGWFLGRWHDVEAILIFHEAIISVFCRYNVRDLGYRQQSVKDLGYYWSFISSREGIVWSHSKVSMSASLCLSPLLEPHNSDL